MRRKDSGSPWPLLSLPLTTPFGGLVLVLAMVGPLLLAPPCSGEVSGVMTMEPSSEAAIRASSAVTVSVTLTQAVFVNAPSPLSQVYLDALVSGFSLPDDSSEETGFLALIANCSVDMSGRTTAVAVFTFTGCWSTFEVAPRAYQVALTLPASFTDVNVDIVLGDALVPSNPFVLILGTGTLSAVAATPRTAGLGDAPLVVSGDYALTLTVSGTKFYDEVAAAAMLCRPTFLTVPSDAAAHDAVRQWMGEVCGSLGGVLAFVDVSDDALSLSVSFPPVTQFNVSNDFLLEVTLGVDDSEYEFALDTSVLFIVPPTTPAARLGGILAVSAGTLLDGTQVKTLSATLRNCRFVVDVDTHRDDFVAGLSGEFSAVGNSMYAASLSNALTSAATWTLSSNNTVLTIEFTTVDGLELRDEAILSLTLPATVTTCGDLQARPFLFASPAVEDPVVESPVFADVALSSACGGDRLCNLLPPAAQSKYRFIFGGGIVTVVVLSLLTTIVCFRLCRKKKGKVGDKATEQEKKKKGSRKSGGEGGGVDGGPSSAMGPNVAMMMMMHAQSQANLMAGSPLGGPPSLQSAWGGPDGMGGATIGGGALSESMRGGNLLARQASVLPPGMAVGGGVVGGVVVAGGGAGAGAGAGSGAGGGAGTLKREKTSSLLAGLVVEGPPIVKDPSLSSSPLKSNVGGATSGGSGGAGVSGSPSMSGGGTTMPSPLRSQGSATFTPPRLQATGSAKALLLPSASVAQPGSPPGGSKTNSPLLRASTSMNAEASASVRAPAGLMAAAIGSAGGSLQQ